MNEQDELRNQSDLEKEGVGGGESPATDVPCFRCGICCRIYQVRIERHEAEAISAHMGMELYDWVGKYCDPRWRGTESFLVRHEGDGCVFLVPDDRKCASCSIHGVRPLSCREWEAGLHKEECREGLRSRWHITVSSGGMLEGSAKALTRFQEFLTTLE
ncbi:MAG: YkgJ family cysteine cluster protein [Dehalococcoidia bacterium]|nr:YkgJ family cysteine cluster protein [Dehalococcoidia bacterium]